MIINTQNNTVRADRHKASITIHDRSPEWKAFTLHTSIAIKTIAMAIMSENPAIWPTRSPTDSSRNGTIKDALIPSIGPLNIETRLRTKAALPVLVLGGSLNVLIICLEINIPSYTIIILSSTAKAFALTIILRININNYERTLHKGYFVDEPREAWSG